MAHMSRAAQRARVPRPMIFPLNVTNPKTVFVCPAACSAKMPRSRWVIITTCDDREKRLRFWKLGSKGVGSKMTRV